MRREEKIKALLMDVRQVGRECIEPRKGLACETTLPREVWDTLGKAGLLGICLPEQFGGRGLSYQELVLCIEELVLTGGSLGLALVVLLHNLIGAHYIYTFANHGQCRQWLPKLASGKISLGVAVSEKERGAHPKYLKTSAVHVDGEYEILGKKSFVTNGPVADFFVVIAKTGEESGKNLFSAFLVPKGVAGCMPNPPFDIGMLRPSSHGGLVLDRVKVDQDALLGCANQAYQEMVLPFYKLERDLLGTLFAAGLFRQARELIRELRKDCLTMEVKELLGSLKASAGAAMVLSRQVVEWTPTSQAAFESPSCHPRLTGSLVREGSAISQTESLSSLVGVHLGQIADKSADNVKKILNITGVNLPDHLEILGRDLAGLASLSKLPSAADLVP